MVTEESNALARRFRDNLKDIQNQLYVAQSGVTVTTQFLMNQDAAQDCDVANILEYLVGSCLARQIDYMDTLIYYLGTLCVEPAPSESTSTEQAPIQ